MSAFDVTVIIHKQGPLFDGAAPEVIGEWLGDVKKDVADYGVVMLRSFVMDRSGRATGHYQENIMTATLSGGDIRIHDPVIYGPWLQGISERNRSTRFKGYRLWTKTAQVLNDRAKQIMERKLPELIRRLGGE